MLGTKIGRAMRERAATTIAGRDAEDDILRKIIVERTEAVADPGADGWILQFARMPSGLPGELRAMVVMDRPERANHGKVVGALPDMFEPIAHHQSTLPVTPETGL